MFMARKKGITLKAVLIFALFLPTIVYANTSYILSLLLGVYLLINSTIPVIIGLAVIFFLWGLAKFILQTDSVEGRKSARDQMVWGIIAISVMVSIWGLVNLLRVALGFGGWGGLLLLPPASPKL